MATRILMRGALSVIHEESMSFPNLELIEDAKYHSRGQGVPVNGDNEFEIGIDPAKIIGHEDQLEFHVRPLGTPPSVIFVSPTAVLSEDRRKVTLNFTQTGDDEAIVEAIFIHSEDW